MVISLQKLQKMLVLYVVLLVGLTGKGQSIARFPLNAAVVVGQTVTFNCRTESNNSVWWKYKAVEAKMDSILFNSKSLGDYNCDSCTVINIEPGQYNLQITNTRQLDAGTYYCVEIKEISTTNTNVSRADSHAAELIVLASVPECGSNLTGSSASLLKDNDSVRMWCKVGFRGNIAPVMEWRNKANDEIIPSKTNSHQNSKVESEIIIQLKHGDNRGIVYSCTTYFNQSFFPVHGGIESVAKDAPHYTYTWTTQNESRAHWSIGGQELSTETIGLQLDKETFSIWIITSVVICLMMILIFCIISLQLSNKGCFKKVSSTGPNIISQANAEGVSNIFYEDPHASAASPIDGERTNHAIRVYYEDAEQVLNLSSHDALENTQAPDRGALNIATARHDHVYSLEPVHTSFRQQHGHLQNEIPSVTTATTNVGGGGHGPYEEIEVDILRSINNPEERRAVPVNDDVHMQRPTFNGGTDGTIYTQVNTGRGGGGGGGGGGSHVSPRIQQTTPIQSLFSTSVYAQIDHTTRVLPLPPTTRRQ